MTTSPTQQRRRSGYLRDNSLLRTDQEEHVWAMDGCGTTAAEAVVPPLGLRAQIFWPPKGGAVEMNGTRQHFGGRGHWRNPPAIAASPRGMEQLLLPQRPLP
jgi:hypothetical protein